MNLVTKYTWLIERLIDLSMCRSTHVDNRYRWFYSLISPEEAIIAGRYMGEEDLRQSLYLYIMELLNDNPSVDGNSLKKTLVWQTVNILKSLYNYHRLTRSYADFETYICTVDKPVQLDIRWLLGKDKLLLTDYEKYLLYLRLYRCLSLEEISDITYQSISATKNSIKVAIRAMKNSY